MSKSRSPAGVPGMMACAAASSRSSTGILPAAARASTRRALSRGKNAPATSRCTRATSSALQTDGRLVLAFSMMFRAFSRSASLSTYTWQMPVPVSMQGTVADSTHARMSPAPPRGMSRSTRPEAVISSCALRRVGSETRLTNVSGRPASRSPSCMAATMAAAERYASLPPRSTQTLPLFMASTAASEVTFGRLS